MFLDADNRYDDGVFDLDPREGFVRLGRTEVGDGLGYNVSHVQGLMNPSGDLQAILSHDGVDSVLTLSDFGRSISLKADSRGRLCEQRVRKTSKGLENYASEITQVS